MLTPREIAKDLEGVRQLCLKQNITPEDINVIFDLLKVLYERIRFLAEREIKYRSMYQKLYMKVHNIPENAIVEWKEGE
jgi:hypothetical protein